jgi:hypothetical protein
VSPCEDATVKPIIYLAKGASGRLNSIPSVLGSSSLF